MASNMSKIQQFNPRSLLQDAVKSTSGSTAFRVRLDDAYAGTLDRLEGSANMHTGLEFNQVDLNTQILPWYKHQTVRNTDGVSNTEQWPIACSQTYWFEWPTMALRGHSTYASNYTFSAFPGTTEFIQGDWMTIETSALALPNETVTVNFDSTATVYTSAVTPLSPRRRVSTGLTYTFDPLRCGQAFEVTGWSFSVQLSLLARPGTDIIRYRWLGLVTPPARPAVPAPVELWVSLGRRKIEAVISDKGFVLTDRFPPYSTRKENIRFTRASETGL